jgi:23S rRNA pseudouridine955/2504/2580 synthase
MKELVLGAHDAGQRLDRYLRKLLPRIALGTIFKHLRNGVIRIDGRKVAGDLRIQGGMRLQLGLPDDVLPAEAPPAADPPAPTRGEPVAPPLREARRAGAARPAVAARDGEPRIVRKDDTFLVVSKPAGLAVHGGSGVMHSVVDWLGAQRVGVRSNVFKPAPAHRIDRGTSGLLLIGLTPAGQRQLTKAFRDGAVTKVYHAVVHGVPKERTGVIAAALLVDKDADRRDAKVRVDPRGQSARTEYEVVRSSHHYALLAVRPREGRQHQIRAHLAHLGHPILGDHRYGSVADTGKGFLLHCSELTFPHPLTGKPVHCTDPLPASFLTLFEPE